MDHNKLSYFIAKYRALDDEEFAEAKRRVNGLAEEAAAAVRQVSSERGDPLPDSSQEPLEIITKLTETERVERTRLSTELWNSPLSRRVQFQFSAQAIVFSIALLGTSGLRFGAIWLVAVAAALYFLASKIGRSHTRSICANAETSIEEKRESLRRTSIVLWPVLVVSALLGAGLSNLLRGA